MCGDSFVFSLKGCNKSAQGRALPQRAALGGGRVTVPSPEGAKQVFQALLPPIFLPTNSFTTHHSPFHFRYSRG